MDDLLEEMGWEIVCEESSSFPGKRSRLNNHEDLCLILNRNSEADAVKGIVLDINLEQLWEGIKDAPRLKLLILCNSQKLTSLPDLSYSPCLEA
ncbi:hypothetical protein Q3G72_017923 [Acer saccharum]|nr:hypothetical protein Q3G72_017923 [Acer saccharum]